MIRLTLGTSASANAFVSFATAPAIVISSSTVVAKPSTFVSVSTGMLNASHFLTKAAAFSQPAVVRRASYFATVYPFSSNSAVLFATAPTVIPSRQMKPVTISFA